MSINENDRLDLRQAFEVLFDDPRLAEIAMEAMPPLDYSSFATKRDLDALGAGLRGEMAELRGEMAELRGEMAELRGEVKGDIAQLRTEAVNNLRIMVGFQLGTMMMLGGWVAAIT